MIDILRDSVWQFAGVVMGALAIVATIIIYYMQKQRKEVAFGIVSAHNLLTVAEELANRVVVLFDKKPVTSIRLIVIGIKNSGDKPVLKEDFERPLSISFGSEARILSVDITKQSPENLGATINRKERSLNLVPVLLNPGDYVVLQLLIATPKVDLQTDTRIVGVPSLVPLNTGTRFRPGSLRDLFINVFLCLAIGFVLFWLSGLESAHQNPPKAPASDWKLLIWFAIIALLFPIISLRDWIVGRVKNHARRYIDDA